MGAIVFCSLCVISPLVAFLSLALTSWSHFAASFFGIIALGASLNAIFWGSARASNSAIMEDGVTEDGARAHVTAGVSLCWVGILPLMLLPLVCDSVGGLTTESGSSNGDGTWTVIIISLTLYPKPNHSPNC